MHACLCVWAADRHHPPTTNPTQPNRHTGSSAVAFKVKTTQPKRYLVKPNQGILEPGQSERIQIQIVPKDRAALAAKPQAGAADRFLIQVTKEEEGRCICREGLTCVGNRPPPPWPRPCT